MHNFGQEHELQYLEKFAYAVKSGFQILYSVEQFSSLSLKDKLNARGTHTPTHDPPSLRMSWENCRAVLNQQPTCVVRSWRLKECFPLP